MCSLPACEGIAVLAVEAGARRTSENEDLLIASEASRMLLDLIASVSIVQYAVCLFIERSDSAVIFGQLSLVLQRKSGLQKCSSQKLIE